jgi:hypothetical protein
VFFDYQRHALHSFHVNFHYVSNLDKVMTVTKKQKTCLSANLRLCGKILEFIEVAQINDPGGVRLEIS